ncbi:hypothetical protein [Teredinibacter haidensis]|uniref:hypothetical protein n=1 Tax=Teredinibacter haidensis TaxID=2731755 RepID=UPI0009489E5A|nr:hypothetical protein [Teredinibacter haidensis]
MENFKHRKIEVVFKSITGEVLGQNKYSETHVSSSGGGGYIDKHGGHVDAPQIHSKSVTNHEFWIRKQDGTEENVQLKGHDIPLRAGQIITLISAFTNEKRKPYYSVLVNHNAKKHWFINKANELNRFFCIDVFSGKSLVLAGGLWWGVAYLLSAEFGAIAAGIFLLYRLITKFPRMSRLEKELDAYLESLAQKAYAVDYSPQSTQN